MLKLNDNVIYQKRFPDGTLNMKVDIQKYEPINVIEWHYEDDSELFSLICLTKKVKDRWNLDTLVRLYLPYIPHARMDRVHDIDDVFTLKYFAETINSLGFDRVVVDDPHSSVAAALIDRLEVTNLSFTLEEVLDRMYHRSGDEVADEVFTVCYPDEGSMKRYSGMINEPYVFGVKRRDWATGKILGLDIIGNPDMVKGQDILIVDDICSRGGTFYHTAKKLKEMGAGDIYLYVTHCENTVLEGDLLEGDLIKQMFTTGSIFTKQHPKIEVL